MRPLLLALLVAVPACAKARADCIGDTCRPALAGTTLGGETLGEDTLRGRVVVVNFWATWCAPCQAELPAIEAVHRRHRDDGVVVVGVLTADHVTDEGAARFAAGHHVSYPLVRSTPALERAVGFGSMLPMTYVYDRQGKLHRTFAGALDEEALEDEVSGLLGG